jgi:predicted nicotinamide N-methyase
LPLRGVAQSLMSRVTSSSTQAERCEEFARFRAEVEQSVALTESTATLAGHTLPWFKVADPDALLTAAVECQDKPATEVDPFWAVLWRAAQGLDAYLQRVPLDGVRVLELGCGAGQAGIAAALRGARVTLSDAVPLALRVAELNAWPVRERVTFERLTWAEGQLDAPPFPIVIGSDLVYDPHHFPQLAACARRHLAPGGRLLLSEPHRHTGDRFAGWIREAGWESREHDLDLQDGRVAIRVFECWWPDASVGGRSR